MFFLTNIKFIPECYYGDFNTNRNTKKKIILYIKKNFFLVSNKEKLKDFVQLIYTSFINILAPKMNRTSIQILTVFCSTFEL